MSLMEIVNCQIRGLTGFTRFTILSEMPPDGFTWSGCETDEKTNDPINCVESKKVRQIMTGNVETYV